MYKQILIISIVVFCFGCGPSEKDTASKKEPAKTSINSKMQKSSELLVSGFMASLKSELMSAVKEGGFANATKACQLQAPLVLENFTHENWSIKRVTEKPRNPLNLADKHEMEILKKFTDSMKELEFYDEWLGEEKLTNYAYYQPIYVGKLCLKCHGDKNSIEPEIVQVLSEKYPQDNAFDYKEGDLRGMFVVHIETPDDIINLEESIREK